MVIMSIHYRDNNGLSTGYHKKCSYKVQSPFLYLEIIIYFSYSYADYLLWKIVCQYMCELICKLKRGLKKIAILEKQLLDFDNTCLIQWLVQTMKDGDEVRPLANIFRTHSFTHTVWLLPYSFDCKVKSFADRWYSHACLFWSTLYFDSLDIKNFVSVGNAIKLSNATAIAAKTFIKNDGRFLCVSGMTRIEKKRVFSDPLSTLEK